MHEGDWGAGTENRSLTRANLQGRSIREHHGDIFAKQGRKLYFYGEGAHFEIDFVIRQGGKAVPVEVKSAANRKAKSMKSILDRGIASQGMKLSAGNRGTSGAVETYPLYLAPFIKPDGGL